MANYEWVKMGCVAPCQRCGKRRQIYVQQPGDNVICKGCQSVVDRGCHVQCQSNSRERGPGHHAMCFDPQVTCGGIVHWQVDRNGEFIKEAA